MVNTRFLTEKYSKTDTGQLLRVAGFVAVFIEASYLAWDWSNVVFSKVTGYVMLQHFAV